MNYSKSEAESIQSSFGVIVQGKEEIEDSVLKGSFFKVLPKDAVLENSTTHGWSNLIGFTLPPSNSMVIADDYLFSNDENGQTVGKFNLIQLIDAFLPSTLAIPYHVIIISNDQPESRKPPRSETWCSRIATELKCEISALRQFQIIVEIIFTQSIHPRKLLLNYINATTDKGFAIFRTNDGRTVRDENDFRCDRVFNRVGKSDGDSDYMVVDELLVQLKRKYSSIKEFIGNRGQMVHNRILGDCNSDCSVKNRLINDV